MHQRLHSPAAILLLLLLTPVWGCKLGPNYKRPALETPTDWRWKTAEPQDHLPHDGWWNVFEDSNLDTLQKEAAANNLDLKAALARVEQARATARIERSYFYPSLTANPSFVRYRTSGHSPSPVPFPVPSFTQQQWTLPFDLSYELDLWGRVGRSFESTRELALGAVAAREAILLTLQADVAANYFSLQSVTREIDLLDQAIGLRNEAVDIFNKRLQAGIGSEFEVQRGKTEAASAQAQSEAARRRRAELINALALLCGKAP